MAGRHVVRVQSIPEINEWSVRAWAASLTLAVAAAIVRIRHGLHPATQQNARWTLVSIPRLWTADVQYRSRQILCLKPRTLKLS